MELAERLPTVLAEILPVQREDDGALTVQHEQTFASLRVVTIAEGLELVSLTQVLAWDLPLNAAMRATTGSQAGSLVGKNLVGGQLLLVEGLLLLLERLNLVLQSDLKDN